MLLKTVSKNKLRGVISLTPLVKTEINIQLVALKNYQKEKNKQKKICLFTKLLYLS
tara:strand:+ start:1160 stop:1327 length:168 start_codon:yes stop_codon:yes gene_type:complete